MKTFRITYDLNKEGQAYSKGRDKVIKAIESLGEALHIASTTYLVRTSLGTAQAVVDTIGPVFDANDRLFVSQLCGDYQGWLTEKQWEWIANSPKCC